MRVEHKPINFEDDRGAIRDIFTDGGKEAVTVITSVKGAVRGNHYHKRSVQYVFVVSGKLAAYSQKLGEKTIERHMLGAGDLIIHEPNEVHAFVAEEDTVFLAFAEGLRKGEDYEKDTYRVNPPLHVAFGEHGEV